MSEMGMRQLANANPAVKQELNSRQGILPAKGMAVRQISELMHGAKQGNIQDARDFFKLTDALINTLGNDRESINQVRDLQGTVWQSLGVNEKDAQRVRGALFNSGAAASVKGLSLPIMEKPLGAAYQDSPFIAPTFNVMQPGLQTITAGLDINRLRDLSFTPEQIKKFEEDANFFTSKLTGATVKPNTGGMILTLPAAEAMRAKQLAEAKGYQTTFENQGGGITEVRLLHPFGDKVDKTVNEMPDMPKR